MPAAKAKVPNHLREHIRSIREHLPSKPTAAEYAPHVAMLKELGYQDREINAGFGWETSMRWLREVKRAGRMDGLARVKVEPTAVARDKLDEQYQQMLEYTPEAFIAFYNRFNNQPLPAHCEEWIRAVFAHKLLLLNVPPRHNKSTLFAVWWVVWNIVRDRDQQALVLSLTDTLSRRWVGYIAALLSSGEIPIIFGRFKPEKMDGEVPWRPSNGELMVLGRKKSAAGTAMQFSVLSRGQGSQILGFEADLIVGDDITTKKIAVSEVVRQEQIEWWGETVMTRQNPAGSRVVMVGQRVHVNDIYGHLKEQVRGYGKDKGQPVWHNISYPAVLRWPQEDDGSDAVVLWPEVWSFERLMESYDEVGGEAAFYTMYQQDPQSADAVLVREEWLAKCRDEARPVGVGAPAVQEDQEFVPVARVVSLDPSPTAYNGMIVADVVSARDAFWCIIVDIKSFKSNWHSIREEINRTIEKYHPTYFIFEKNIAQEWTQGDPFIEDLRSKVRVIEHTTSSQNKFAVDLGLESLSFEFEMGRIRMPYKDAEARAVSGILERECRNWTREGRLRDDVLMALWFIKYNWRKLTPLNRMPRTFRGMNQVEHAYRQRFRQEEDVVAAYRKRREAMRRRSA